MDADLPNGPEDHPQGTEGSSTKGPAEPAEEDGTTGPAAPTMEQTEAPPLPNLGMAMDLDEASSPQDVKAQGDEEDPERAKQREGSAEPTEPHDANAEPTEPLKHDAEPAEPQEDEAHADKPDRPASPLRFSSEDEDQGSVSQPEGHKNPP